MKNFGVAQPAILPADLSFGSAAASRLRWRLWCRRMRIALAVLLGVLCLALLGSALVPLLLLPEKDEDIVQIDVQQTLINNGMAWSPCVRNTSMAVHVEGFSSLPAHIQDFLYYRHCRHFPLLLDVPDKCGGPERSGDVFLLLAIKSHPWHYERREVLRKTWAEERTERGKQIRRLFLVGTTTGNDGGYEQRMNQMLTLEQREHGDILQWDFDDSLYNFTLKQVLFLEWLDRNCPRVRFLLDGGDDVFANTDKMVEYLMGNDANDEEHLYVGYVINDRGPNRSPASKYYIPVQVQESESYPPYVTSMGILLSGHTASVIYEMSKSITLHPIDNAYLGMCVAKAGLKPDSHMGFKHPRLLQDYAAQGSNDPLHACFYRETLLAHGLEPPLLSVMWGKARDPDIKCGKM